MNINKRYISLLVVVTLFSCKENHSTTVILNENNSKWLEYITHNNQQIMDSIIEYNNDGTIAFITEVNNVPKDSLPYSVIGKSLSYKDKYINGYVYHFDSLGNISKKLHCTLGKMDGMQYAYYPNGKLKVKTNYKNGKIYGERYEYSEKGILNFYGKFSGKTPVGGASYYDSLGRIKKYMFLNDDGLVVYIRRYDTSGHVIKEEGDSTVK
jgi:antitoxin component YwqK of YwqJK toxin-antitoxin module